MSRHRMLPGGIPRGLRGRRRLLAILLLLAPSSAAAPPAAETGSSCIDCHSNPDLLVTDKKLYDYFQQWQQSIHRQEDVTCVDCHGGNPEVADKKGAHGENLAEAEKESAVNFRNIPRTCGECHDEIFRGFRRSRHFEHLVTSGQEAQGPTCVTCHGSINVAVLNVTTVEQTCSKCHNQESENHPEIPGKARRLLNRFLSIHRYYRYITVRGDPVETRDFFRMVDDRLHDLTVTWHTFELGGISERTESVLADLRKRREQVARAFKERRAARTHRAPPTSLAGRRRF